MNEQQIEIPRITWERKECDRKLAVKDAVLLILAPLGFKDADDNEDADLIVHSETGTYILTDNKSMSEIIMDIYRHGKESGRKEVRDAIKTALWIGFFV